MIYIYFSNNDEIFMQLTFKKNVVGVVGVVGDSRAMNRIGAGMCCIMEVKLCGVKLCYNLYTGCRKSNTNVLLR